MIATGSAAIPKILSFVESCLCFNYATCPDPLLIYLLLISLIPFWFKSSLSVQKRNPTISRWVSFGLRLPNLVAFRLVNLMVAPVGYVFGVAGYNSSISLRAFASLPISRSLIKMWVTLRSLERGVVILMIVNGSICFVSTSSTLHRGQGQQTLPYSHRDKDNR